MPKSGLGAALEFHNNNTGSLPYTPLKLAKDGERAMVRILAKGDVPQDADGNQVPVEGERYIQSLFFHKVFQVLDERCLNDEDIADPNVCPLCRVKAPRTMKTFIPMRVRGDKQKDRVHWFVVGREVLQSFISLSKEIPNGDLTGLDIVIRREGEKLQTRYLLYPQQERQGPLGPEEKALEFDDPDNFYPMKSESDLEGAALAFQRSTQATSVNGSTSHAAEQDEVPF